MPVRVHGGTSQSPVRYLFVDAGHLKPNFSDITKRWFGREVNLEFGMLRDLFAATKIFYYDCIDDVQKAGESSEQLEQRIHQQEAALREINSVPNTHVRYGSITGRDRRKRRQKEVDILIAVDMMNHAVRQNMDHAILLTGDRDFTPLVETLVQFGLIVEVAGDFRYTSDILREAADNFRRLALQDYMRLVEQREQQKCALPQFVGQAVPPAQAGDPPLTSGPVDNELGRLFRVRSQEFALEISNRYGARYVALTTLADVARATLFLELQYGEVHWLRQYLATPVS